MNVLSLFSGIGGLDLGLQRAGMRIVGQVEIDPWCRTVLEKHWPQVPRHPDVKTCVKWWRAEGRPDVRLVCAGFPCQPVSFARSDVVDNDPRWLWPDTAAVLGALRPTWALLENVTGLLRHGRLGAVLGDLARLGYDTRWDCLAASAFGAPHRRDRVFVVAALADADREPPVGLAVARPQSHPWAAEPDVGRVAHGVPARMDRIRALGNACVPQVAEHVGRHIIAADRGATT